MVSKRYEIVGLFINKNAFSEPNGIFLVSPQTGCLIYQIEKQRKVYYNTKDKIR